MLETREAKENGKKGVSFLFLSPHVSRALRQKTQMIAPITPVVQPTVRGGRFLPFPL